MKKFFPSLVNTRKDICFDSYAAIIISVRKSALLMVVCKKDHLSPTTGSDISMIAITEAALMKAKASKVIFLER